MFHNSRFRGRRALLGVALAGVAALAGAGTAAADFIFPQSPPFEGKQRLYHVIKAKHSGLVLNVPDASTANGKQIIQWSNPDAMNGQWETLKTSPTSVGFHIRNRWSRQCLDAGETQQPAPVVQKPCDGTASQLWLVEGGSPPFRHIRNAHANLDLNISGGSTALGGELITFERVAGAPNTLFEIDPRAFVTD